MDSKRPSRKSASSVPASPATMCPFGASFKTKHKATYASLIALAIESSPKKQLMLNDVYAFVEAHRALVPTASHPNWKNSVRHNLSLRSCFRKVPRWAADGKKLSAYWEVDHATLPPAAATVIAQIRVDKGDVPAFPFKKFWADASDDEDEGVTTINPATRHNGAPMWITPEGSDAEASAETQPAMPGAPGGGPAGAMVLCPYSGQMYFRPTATAMMQPPAGFETLEQFHAAASMFHQMQQMQQRQMQPRQMQPQPRGLYDSASDLYDSASAPLTQAATAGYYASTTPPRSPRSQPKNGAAAAPALAAVVAAAAAGEEEENADFTDDDDDDEVDRDTSSPKVTSPKLTSPSSSVNTMDAMTLLAAAAAAGKATAVS